MASVIDTLKYDITGNTSKYDSAVMRSQGKTKTFDGSVVKLGRAITGLIPMAGALAGTAALGGVVSVLGSGIKSMAEWEQRTLRTEALIRATGNAAGLTAKELAQFANQLDLTTLGNRDNIMDAINAMQTFKSVSGDVFKESIQLSMDLSEVFGTDVSNQAMQLGKALEDPTRGLSALRRVGVSFTEEQKELIRSLEETGKKAEAQRVILKALKEQVGGAAEGAAGGLAGSMDTLSFKWRAFKEDLAGTPTVIKNVEGAISNLTGMLESLSKAASLRSVSGTMTQGAELAKKGLIEWDAFIEAGFHKRQEMVDKILNNPLFQGGYSDNEAIDAQMSPLGYEDATPGSDGNGVGLDAAINQEFYDLDTAAHEEYLAQKQLRQEELVLFQMELEEAEWSRKQEALQAQSDLEWELWNIKESREEAAFNAFVKREDAKDKLRVKTMRTALKQGKFALQAMGKDNEAALNAYKAIAITETTINTAKAAMGAFSAMSSIPIVGPVLGAIAAAAAIAYGVAQISAISSASTGGSPSASGGAVGTYSASPDTGLPDIDPAEAKETKGSLHIVIHGDVIGEDEFIDNLVDKINDAQDRDVFIEKSKGTV